MKTAKSYSHYSFDDKDPICDRIAVIIRGMGLTYKEVADLSGMHYSTIYAILEGRTRFPRFATIARIVTGLDQSDLPIIEQKQKPIKKKRLRGEPRPRIRREQPPQLSVSEQPG